MTKKQCLALSLLITALLLAGRDRAHAATMTVDRTDDAAAATACTPAPNDCSLRGAAIASNGTAAGDPIVVPAGTYVLTTSGAHEDAAATGDLDVLGGSGNGSSRARGGRDDHRRQRHG
jgi:hypothetical protein